MDLMQYVMEFIDYNPSTGIFLWKKSPSNNVKAGSQVGVISEGYRLISLKNKKYPASHVAWFIMTGAFPVMKIDHIDTDKLNDAWHNLREVTTLENAQNRISAYKNNKLGMLGVHRNKHTGRFVAQISVRGKVQRLGSFKTPEEAQLEYFRAKRIKHGAFKTGAGTIKGSL